MINAEKITKVFHEGSDKEIFKFIIKNVNKENVNTPIDLGDRRGRILELTPLQIAIQSSSIKGLQALLDIGADPNQSVKQSSARAKMFEETPLNLLSTGHCQCRLEMALILINNGANTDSFRWVPFLKDYYGSHKPNETKVESLEDRLKREKLENLENLLTYISPVFLDDIKLVTEMIPNITQWMDLFENHAMIKNIINHEKVTVSFEKGSPLKENEEEFFSHSSIKDALNERYGVSSPRLVNIISKRLFNKKGSHVVINCSILHKGDVLKKLFLESEKNESDFLDFMEKDIHTLDKVCDSLLGKTNQWMRGMYNFDGFVNNKIDGLDVFKNFSQSQVKGILQEKVDLIENQFVVIDTFKMYQEHPAYFNNLIKETKPKVRSVTDLHDWLSIESTKMATKDFPLRQEEHVPNILKINGKELLDGYKIKVAESSHELIYWGNKLGHCVGNGSYAREALKGQTNLLCITKNDEPAYCVEFRGNQIVQIQGKSRRSPEDPLLESFLKEMKTHELIN